MQSSHRLRDLLPQFFPAHWLEDISNLVWSPFPSRIRIGYVTRGQGGYSFLLQEDQAEISADLSQIHDSALANLEALEMPSLSVGRTAGGPEAFLSEVQDNFLAARILLPRVQRGFARALGPVFRVAIPCRDFLVAWSPAQDSARQAHNVSEARTIFLEDEYNLTPDILQFDDGAFSVLIEQQLDG